MLLISIFKTRKKDVSEKKVSYFRLIFLKYYQEKMPTV